MIRTLSLNLQRLDALLDLLRWYARQPKVRPNLARRPLFVVSDLWALSKDKVASDSFWRVTLSMIRKKPPAEAFQSLWSAWINAEMYKRVELAEYDMWKGMTR